MFENVKLKLHLVRFISKQNIYFHQKSNKLISKINKVQAQQLREYYEDIIIASREYSIK